MMKILTLLALSTFIFVIHVHAEFSSEAWENHTGPQLNVESVDIKCVRQYANEFKKKGDNTLGGPGSAIGVSTFCMDAYTAPTWATASPSFFTIEQYVFAGGSAAIVDHRVIWADNAGIPPRTLALGFAWQPCGNEKIFPPVPMTLGTSRDGSTIFLTLPYSGLWYLTVGISGFSEGTYDWVWLTYTGGTAPVPVPPGLPGLGAGFWDIGGADNGPFLGGDYHLHNVSDLNFQPGNGYGSGRPWCFRVDP